MVIDVTSGAARRPEGAGGESRRGPAGGSAIGQALKEISKHGTEIPAVVPSVPGVPGVPNASGVPDARRLETVIRQQVKEQLKVQAESAASGRSFQQKVVQQRRLGMPSRRLGLRRDSMVRWSSMGGRGQAQGAGEERGRFCAASWRGRTRRGRDRLRSWTARAASIPPTDGATRQAPRRAACPDSRRARSATSVRWILDDWVVASERPGYRPRFRIAGRAARRGAADGGAQLTATAWGHRPALFGILPLSTRMTRNLHIVRGRGPHRPRRPGHPLPVRSKNEFASSPWPSTAGDRSQAAPAATGGGRTAAQEQEIEQALLQTEYDRKSRDLEERGSSSRSCRRTGSTPGFEIACRCAPRPEVAGTITTSCWPTTAR